MLYLHTTFDSYGYIPTQRAFICAYVKTVLKPHCRLADPLEPESLKVEILSDTGSYALLKSYTLKG